MDIRRIGSIKDGDAVIGSRVKVKVVKNKMAAPFKDAEFDILYNEGISHEGELLDMAVEKNLVQKSGTWFSHGDERIGQGRENARAWLKEHRDAADEIEGKLRTALGIGAPAAPAAPEGSEPVAAAAGEGRGERRVRI
jgi:recombination protein RecA